MVDPFCGSGAVGEAALRCGRAFLGLDADQAAYEASKARLHEVAERLKTGAYPTEAQQQDVRRLYVRGDTIHHSTQVRATAGNWSEARGCDCD